MSGSTLQQLRESYGRVIQNTLMRVREQGILRQAAVIDELRCRWESAVERELRAMEAQLGGSVSAKGESDDKSKVRLLGPALAMQPGTPGFASPGALPTGLVSGQGGAYRPMDGIDFAEAPPALSGAPSREQLEDIRARRGDSGFDGTNRHEGVGADVPPLAVGLAEEAAGAQAAKRTRRSSEPVPVAPAVKKTRCADAAPVAGAGADAEDDDEYDGCFAGAETVVSKDGADREGGGGSAGSRMPKGPAATAAPKQATDAETLAEVNRCKLILESKQATADQLSDAISDLRELGDLSSRIVRDTAIGKVVSKLAKSSSAESRIKEKARSLVDTWRDAHVRRKTERHAATTMSFQPLSPHELTAMPSPGPPLSPSEAPAVLPLPSPAPQPATSPAPAPLSPAGSPSQPAARKAAAGSVAAASAAAGADEDSDDDCFKDAEVLVSGHAAQSGGGDDAFGEDPPGSDDEGSEAAKSPASRRRTTRQSPGADDGAESASDGSDLGSELDDSEFDEPATDNFLYADFARVRRGRRRWMVQFKHGVMRVHGVECLFSSASGVFDCDAPPDFSGVEREGGADMRDLAGA